MPRYSAKPRQTEAWWDDYPLQPDLTVFDSEPMDTGLLDEHGDPIYRLPEPIGYMRRD